MDDDRIRQRWFVLQRNVRLKSKASLAMRIDTIQSTQPMMESMLRVADLRWDNSSWLTEHMDVKPQSAALLIHWLICFIAFSCSYLFRRSSECSLADVLDDEDKSTARHACDSDSWRREDSMLRLFEWCRSTSHMSSRIASPFTLACHGIEEIFLSILGASSSA